MIWFYKKSLLNLISKLKELKEDKNNLGLLLDIQESLIKKLIYLENRISKLNQKSKNVNKILSQGRLSKIEAKKLKDERETTKIKISEYNWLLFVFRTIGDGIVFSYLDKWNIKPLAFQDASPNYKQDSGFISGKLGLGAELKLLHSAIEHGVPAILTDLTNSIRYGDICLMGESVPRLIEIKSSKNTGARVSRQLNALKHVQSYLDTDTAIGLRGYTNMHRVDLHSVEINHMEMLNDLIDKTFDSQFSYKEVEPGVHYCVQRADANLKNLREHSQIIRKPIFYYLNTLKNAGQWVNYYPFTLSIKNTQDIYQFLRGDIQIIVLVDFATVEEYAKKKGFEAKIFDDLELNVLIEAYNKKEPEIPFSDKQINNFVGGSILFKNPKLEPSEGSFIMSHNYLSRAAYEFTSLEWLLDEAFLQYEVVASQRDS